MLNNRSLAFGFFAHRFSSPFYSFNRFLFNLWLLVCNNRDLNRRLNSLNWSLNLLRLDWGSLGQCLFGLSLANFLFSLNRNLLRDLLLLLNYCLNCLLNDLLRTKYVLYELHLVIYILAWSLLDNINRFNKLFLVFGFELQVGKSLKV